MKYASQFEKYEARIFSLSGRLRHQWEGTPESVSIMESDRILVKWEYQNFVKLNFLVLLYSGKPFRLYCPNLLQSSCKRKEQANAFIVDEHIVTSHYAHHIFAVISFQFQEID